MLTSPVKIAHLEEARQAAGVAGISIESEKIAGGTMCFGGKGSQVNQAQGIGLNGPVTDDEIDRFVDFFTSRGVEPKIEVCPFVDDSLVEGLERRGFTMLEFENVLARSVTAEENLDALMPRPLPCGIDLVTVDPDNATQVDTYAQITSSGFFPEGEAVPPLMIESAVRCVRHPRSKAVLALVDGTHAGGGGMEVTSEISCFFGASVLPPYRRRGIQAALILERLKQVQAAGCGLAAIHSKPGIPTERNAMRLGFRMAYSKVIMRLQGEGLLPSP